MSQPDVIKLSDTAPVLMGQTGARVIVHTLVGQPASLIGDYQQRKRPPLVKSVPSVIQPKREAALVQPPHPAVTQRPLQILVAEDDLLNQKVVLHLLGRLGYQAEAVNDGRDVLTALQHRHYDLLLLDLHLPLMGGLEVARYLQANWSEGGSKPRLVAMTASIATRDRERCLAAGMDDYLSKPIRLENLQSTLARNPLTSPVVAAKAMAESALFAPDSDKVEAAKTDSPVLDRAVLHTLEAELTQAPGVFNKLVKSYPVTSRRLIEQAQAALWQADSQGLLLAVHSLYSPSATLGAMQVAALCRELESIARTLVANGSKSFPAGINLKARLKDLEQATQAAIALLKAEVDIFS